MESVSRNFNVAARAAACGALAVAAIFSDSPRRRRPPVPAPHTRVRRARSRVAARQHVLSGAARSRTRLRRSALGCVARTRRPAESAQHRGRVSGWGSPPRPGAISRPPKSGCSTPRVSTINMNRAGRSPIFISVKIARTISGSGCARRSPSPIATAAGLRSGLARKPRPGGDSRPRHTAGSNDVARAYLDLRHGSAS